MNAGQHDELIDIAPDNRWTPRHVLPELGMPVEMLWTDRQTDSRGGVIARGSMKVRGVWANERGEALIFNPAFWRPAAP